MLQNGEFLILAGLDVLRLARDELLLFACFWFVIGALDELVMDLIWLWLRSTGRASSGRLDPDLAGRAADGRFAVFVPAWQEAAVIGPMIDHTLRMWGHHDMTLYVGCYRNDLATMAAARVVGGTDPRLRIVLHDADGPTTKADCLNAIYAAMCRDEAGDDEARSKAGDDGADGDKAGDGRAYRGIVLQDAEDMVHPAGLAVIARGLAEADFVQLPVCPELQPRSPWIAGHYADEFVEAHGKALVTRDALGAALPSAGVGCGFARDALARLVGDRPGPFNPACLTEDYELGLRFTRDDRRGRFLRLRDGDGRLIGTRSFFPCAIGAAVRQKTRWVHGIALQGWDHLGWSGRPVDLWMAMRDRRGPLTALVFAAGYLLLLIEAVLLLADWAGFSTSRALPPPLVGAMLFTAAAFVWRAAFRCVFTAREYGLAQGLLGILRIPVANVIAIMAGARALVAYVRNLSGSRLVWDKTIHSGHPASRELKRVRG